MCSVSIQSEWEGMLCNIFTGLYQLVAVAIALPKNWYIVAWLMLIGALEVWYHVHHRGGNIKGVLFVIFSSCVMFGMLGTFKISVSRVVVGFSVIRAVGLLLRVRL